jgi:hypothetical protein
MNAPICSAALSSQPPKPEGARPSSRAGLTANARAEQ